MIDRTQLILDVLAQHATTRDGKVQVELAQLRYLPPRLARRAQISLSRFAGGIGDRDRARAGDRLTSEERLATGDAEIVDAHADNQGVGDSRVQMEGAPNGIRTRTVSATCVDTRGEANTSVPTGTTTSVSVSGPPGVQVGRAVTGGSVGHHNR